MYLAFKNYIFKVARTITDVGIERIILRLIFEIRKYIDSIISSEILKLFILLDSKTPKWMQIDQYKHSKIDLESLTFQRKLLSLIS